MLRHAITTVRAHNGTIVVHQGRERSLCVPLVLESKTQTFPVHSAIMSELETHRDAANRFAFENGMLESCELVGARLDAGFVWVLVPR